jgi:multiple sugar transport system substrate-binding protein
MKGNKVALIVMAVVLLAGLFGCAPAATPAPAAQPTAAAAQPTKATASTEKVELRLTWWGSQARHDKTIKVIEMFQAKYPNITITYEFAGWADYWTKMTTQAAGNNLPDIMQQDYAYINEWNAKKFLLPLDSYVADGTINLKDVAAASLDGGKIGGKLIALNLGNNSQDFVLDLDAFKKAGVELPKENWTWADFEKICMDLTAKLGYPAFTGDMYNDQFFKNTLITMGQSFYNADGTGLGFSDNKPLVDYLNMVLRLQKAKAIIGREELVANKYTVETDPFVKGKGAITYANSNQLVAQWTAAGETRNFKMWPLPRTDKPTNYYKPSMFFSITTGSKHPKEAAMFIDYFTNSLEANQVLAAERGVPISSAVRNGMKPSLGKAAAEMFDFIARLEGNTSPIPMPDPAGHPDIVNNVWIPLVADAVGYGQATPEKAVETLRTEATTILAKNKKP